MNKKCYLLIATIMMNLLLWTGVAFAAAPSAYVTYSNQLANTVDITIHFDDQAGAFSRVQYATAMLADGSNLDYGANMTISGTNPDRTVTIINANKYMNYYLRIAKPDLAEVANVRLFPVTAGVAGREFNDYAHGNFRTNTPMCGGCHNTHNALKSQLLLKASYYELCLLCHSNANTQSKYDVESGLVSVSGGTTKPSLGGPFINQSAVSTVSKHDADDSVALTPVNVPGSDVSGTKKLGLTCVSCHNGHGGTDDNYRLLKKTVYADDGKTFVANNIDFDAYAITANATSGETISMVKGNTEFCAACHQDYDNGNATVAGGVYATNVGAPGPGTARYRHPVSTIGTTYSIYGNDNLKSPTLEPLTGDVLPLQYNPNQLVRADKRTAVVCSTCHFAHGSIKSFNVQGISYDSKYILRLDNYGTCESCHKK